jgi:hypothetical protein
MARRLAELPKGSRITDYIRLRVMAKTFPVATVKSGLEATGRNCRRQRELPAQVLLYYVIALALYYLLHAPALVDLAAEFSLINLQHHL